MLPFYLMRKYLSLLLLTIAPALAFGQEDNACNRYAIINHQKILVDSSSTIKGDGLKYYLEKDPVAAQYFESYQKNNQPRISSALISSAGTGLVLAGYLMSEDSLRLLNKNTLIGAGITMILVNYFVNKTNSYRNEENLQKSVEEYNKRNSPQIYFNPIVPTSGQNDGMGVNMGVTKEF